MKKGGNVGVEVGTRNFSQNKYNLYSKSITAWACRHAENTFKEQTFHELPAGPERHLKWTIMVNSTV